MCLARNRLNSKARRFLAIGNLCLCASFAITILPGVLAHQHEPAFEAARGFLLGIAITFNF
jgi:hypothetical protein